MTTVPGVRIMRSSVGARVAGRGRLLAARTIVRGMALASFPIHTINQSSRSPSHDAVPAPFADQDAAHVVGANHAPPADRDLSPAMGLRVPAPPAPADAAGATFRCASSSRSPCSAKGAARLTSTLQPNGVEVLTPHTSVTARGFHDDQMAVLKPLIAEFVATRGIVEPIVWLYTPMALPLVEPTSSRAPWSTTAWTTSPRSSSRRRNSSRAKPALMELADVVLHRRPVAVRGAQGPACQHPLPAERRGRGALLAGQPRRRATSRARSRRNCIAACRIRGWASSA